MASNSTPNIMVTGSSGTVGTALVQELIVRKFRVTPVDTRPSYWDKVIDDKTIRCDLRKPINDSRLLKRRFDMIIHLAANARVHDLVVKPQLALDNYLMVHNLLEFARKRGVSRFVFSSSREVYGDSKMDQKRLEDSTHVSRIKAPYTASKFAAEALLHAYRECYDIKPVIVRLSNVYGRYDVSERVIPLFLYYALRDRDITIFGKDKKLDFTYIDDCVDGLIAIIDRFDSVAGRTFNLSAGRGERLLDMARMIVKNLDSKSKIGWTSKRVGEITSFVADISQAKRYLDYRPEVKLAEGVKHNTIWYVEAMKERRIYESQRRNLARRGWA